MAVNKRKILASAQKNLQKGALDKALRDYRSILKADPRDVNVRLKLGDLHLRRGEREPAIAAYFTVAEQFTRAGFDAKAVALYKQITKIDPRRHDVYVQLADLYQRLGLTSEAMSALQVAADAYHRGGRQREALDLLRRMASLDPTNTTSRLKIAELLRQAELTAEALVEYEEAAAELDRQGDWEGRISVLERILELDAGRAPTLEALASVLLEHDQPHRAEAFAKRLIEADPGRPGSYDALANVYRRLGSEDRVAQVYRQLAELYRTRGDEDRAREILQRFVPPEPFDLGAAEEGAQPPSGEVFDLIAHETTPELTAEEELAGVEETLPEETSGPVPTEPYLEEELAGVEETLPEETSGPVPTKAYLEEEPDDLRAGEDPDQLLAEARVFLRYRKHERALECVRAVLARQPDHPEALTALGEALSVGGDAEGAARAFGRAAEVASAAPVEALGGEEEAGDLAELELSPEDEDLGTEDAPKFGATPASVSVDSEEEDLEEIEIELDHVADMGGGSDGPEPSIETTQPAKPTAALRHVMEDLEEADLYFEKGLLDEAEAIYQRILKAAPNYPQVLLRLGEIAAARGQDPGSSVAPRKASRGERGGAAAAESPPEMAFESAKPREEISVEELEEVEIEVEPVEEVTAEEHEPGVSMEDRELDEEPATEAEDLDAEPEEMPTQILEAFDGVEATTGGEIVLAKEARVRIPAAAPKASKPGEPDFDLAAELSEALADQPASTGAPVSAGDDALTAIFRDFKRGVSRALGEGDAETHYDLAIAYREMDLLDDAMEEFQLALAAPARHLDALHMLGLCAIDLGRPGDALGHLEQALAGERIPREREAAIRFDLGRAFEALGDRGHALDAFRRVEALDPDFPEVGDRRAALEHAEDSHEDSNESTDPAEECSEEAHESFEDLIAEVDAEEPADEAADEELPPEDSPSRGPRPRRSRRRKISFV